jgi:hypothetical protein
MLSSPRSPAITIMTSLRLSIAAALRAGYPDDLLSFFGLPFYSRSHRSSFADYDELKPLAYSIKPFCLTGADGKHKRMLALDVISRQMQYPRPL